jgi:hypothetical protein
MCSSSQFLRKHHRPVDLASPLFNKSSVETNLLVIHAFKRQDALNIRAEFGKQSMSSQIERMQVPESRTLLHLLLRG